MCFSPAANFVTAAAAGVIGVASLIRTREPVDWPLALMPLVFAMQQTVGGILWLRLSLQPGNSLSSNVTFLYFVISEVLWPVYVPLAVLLLEPTRKRRRLVLICLAAGLALAAYLLWSNLSEPHAATTFSGHIIYLHTHPIAIAPLFAAVVCLPFLLASRRTIVLVGANIAAGYIVASAFDGRGFVSVWCFFAVVASLVVLGHFEWTRRQASSFAPTSAPQQVLPEYFADIDPDRAAGG